MKEIMDRGGPFKAKKPSLDRVKDIRTKFKFDYRYEIDYKYDYLLQPNF